MRRTVGRAWPALLLAAFTTHAVHAAPLYKGMSYTSFNQNALGSAGSDQSLLRMSMLGVDTVALNFWWFQDTVTSTTMAEDFTRYSSTIASVEHAIDTIHGLGLKVLLKPMLDVKDGTWRANINPLPGNRPTWFANYTNFLGTFADIAQAKGVEMFSIGCELNALEAAVNTTQWTNLIANMRSRYDGKLTYAANHDNGGIGGGYNAITWWNQLDVIGIDAYFVLTGLTNPTPAQLEAAWNTRANSIESWRASRGLTDKQVIFTEVGLSSFNGANMTPWATPSGQAADEQEQAAAYAALLKIMSQRSWWDGAFWWNWETNPNGGGANGFTPQYKLASGVLADAYGGVMPEYPLTAWNQNASGNWAAGGGGGVWSSGSPNNNAAAIFDRGEGIAYNVSLTANRTADQLRIGSNAVTFQSNNATPRTLTTDNQFTTESLRAVRIGLDADDVAVVNLASTISTLTARAATIGDGAGSSGTLNLMAAPTVVNITGFDPANDELIIGRAGTGALNITGGAALNVNGAGGNVAMGKQPGSSGEATVAGAGSTWTIAGELRVGLEGSALLNVLDEGQVQAAAIVTGPGGTLRGDGTLVAAVRNEGRVAPGDLAGVLSIIGSYVQHAGGELVIDLGAPTIADKLSVSGAVSLDGMLTVNLFDDFDPQIGASFDVLDFASLSGEFSTLNLPQLPGRRWDASQLYATGMLSVVAVPEPTATILAAAAMLASAFARRRR